MTEIKPVKLVLDAAIYEDGALLPIRTVRCHGRVAWVVLNLIRAGSTGCTPLDRPAMRWSDYVFKARKLGLNIETIHEAHGGNFPGHHAKYVLHDRVTLAGGTLDAYLDSAEGRREFGNADFLNRRAAA